MPCYIHPDHGHRRLLLDKYLGHITPVMAKIACSQEIQTGRGLWVKVEPDLIGSGQGQVLFLYDLSAGGHQLNQEVSRLIAIELHLQAIGCRIGKSLIADGLIRSGIIGVYNDDDRNAYFP